MSMPPGTSNNIVYTDPKEVFEAFEACPLLRKANVRHFWGAINDKPDTTGARAVWQIRAYDSRPPVQQHDCIVTEPGPDGSKRSYRAIHKVDCAVTAQVELFTDKNGPLTEWNLWKLYVLAAATVLRIEHRYHLSSNLDARDKLSTATDRLVASLTFHIPIHELVATANPTDANVSLRT